MFELICQVIGFLILAHFLKDVVYTLYVLFLAGPLDLPSIYGKSSYAIITGGSKGIGLALAKQLAARGFHLVLIARNKSDLASAKEEIREQFPSVDVTTRSFDFNVLGEPNKEHDMWELLDLDDKRDYSMLVNNVGMANRDILVRTDEEEIKRLLTVNCTSQAVMTHMMLNYFERRGKLSCVVSTSSFATMLPVPSYDLYGGSKAFNRYFALTLVNNPLVDSYTFTPGFVKTGLSRTKGSWFQVEPEASARSAVKFLGRHRLEFCGNWKHELLKWGLGVVPEPIALYFLKKKYRKKLIKKEE